MDHKGGKQVPVLALSQYVTNVSLKTLKRLCSTQARPFLMVLIFTRLHPNLRLGAE